MIMSHLPSNIYFRSPYVTKRLVLLESIINNAFIYFHFLTAFIWHSRWKVTHYWKCIYLCLGNWLTNTGVLTWPTTALQSDTVTAPELSARSGLQNAVSSLVRKKGIDTERNQIAESVCGMWLRDWYWNKIPEKIPSYKIPRCFSV